MPTFVSRLTSTGTLYIGGELKELGVGGKISIDETGTYSVPELNEVASASVDNTVLLLKTASNATKFTDESPNNITLTTSASSPTYNALTPSGGGGSILFNGTSQYLYTNSSLLDLATGGGNWTVECWFYAKTVGTRQPIVNKGWYEYYTNPTYGLFLVDTPTTAGNALRFVIGDGGPYGTYYDHVGIIANTWYHAALVRSNNSGLCFLNGQLVATLTISVMDDNGYSFAIGTQSLETTNNFFNGYISNVRISKKAMYTSNFTPLPPLSNSITLESFAKRETNSTVYLTGELIESSYITATTMSLIPTLVRGEVIYNTTGTYTWTAPAGVTSVSVIAIGAGGAGNHGWGGHNGYDGGAGGGGGGLSYKNNITVIPGNTYTVVVGAQGRDIDGGIQTPGGIAGSGGDSYFINTSTVKGGGGGGASYNVGGTGGSIFGTGAVGGAGSTATTFSSGGGGGAGGYSGAGGAGGAGAAAGTSGTGGSGGGGGGGADTGAGGGGGAGIFGTGASGAGGAQYGGGSGGSGGSNGDNGYFIPVGPVYGGPGGNYGGGGGGAILESTDAFGGAGGTGVVRIIWPGTTRLFPSTDVLAT